MDNQQATGRTLTLKLKYADYQQVTRSKTLPYPIDDLGSILSPSQDSLNQGQCPFLAE
jgi:DNA polymerase-4